MGFSLNEAIVECIIYKPDGKYYTVIELDMTGHYEDLNIGSAILECLEKGRLPVDRPRFQGMWAVVTNPHHRNSHPQMVKIPGDY